MYLHKQKNETVVVESLYCSVKLQIWVSWVFAEQIVWKAVYVICYRLVESRHVCVGVAVFK